MEQLEAQGGSSKFLFPSLKTELRGKKERKCWKLDEAISYDNARCALLNAVKDARLKIKGQNGPFGLHSFRVGALTAAANTGQFSNIQLQSMGRWAQLDSAARYFLPREEEKCKVGLELGKQLREAMQDEALEAAGGRGAACNLAANRVKAASEAGEINRLKTANKRTKGLELKEREELKKQKKQKKKLVEKKKEVKGRLVLVLRRTGKGPEDYDFLPAKV